MNNNTDSREDLKSRMLRHISVIWGVKNTDALDPLVKILIEALAGELQKTHHDINNFEKRILEKIAVLMTPGLLSAPYCAHAIAHAKPVEATQIITPQTQFFYSKKPASSKEKNLEIFFTPVDNLRLFDGNLMYIITGNKCFSIDSNAQKSILMNGKTHVTGKNDIWLGVNLSNQIESVDKLRFYFDLKNTENKQQLLSLLQLSKWYIQSKEIETIKGVVYENTADSKTKEQAIFADYDVMHLIEQEVKYIYNDQFVTLKDENQKFSSKDLRQFYPAEFEAIFTPADLSKFATQLIWIKITTNAYIEEKILFDLFVSINAFPIINRRLKNIAYRFKGITNIIPIKADIFEYFLDVKSLKDIKGRAYSQIPFSQYDDAIETGTYSVRKGGVERLDTRSAKEFLSYLVELMRDEAVIFSSYGQDTVSNLIKDLERTLAQIEQRIKQNDFYNTDTHHYITLEFIESQSTVTVEYWVTNGPHANVIHTGASLNLYQGTEVKINSITLLNTSSGGKKSIDPARHMEAYKYAMLTHNRIVTTEDIKAFCMYELGDKIADVNIRKGLMKSNIPKEGLVRCIDILLKRKQNSKENYSKEEWDLLFNEVKSKMELRSAINANYRLLLAD